MEKISVPLHLAKHINLFISSRDKSIVLNPRTRQKKLNLNGSYIFGSSLKKQSILENGLYLLAQINFSELSTQLLEKTILPKKGFLQLFFNYKNPHENYVSYKNELTYNNITTNNLSFPIIFEFKNELCHFNDIYHSEHYYSSILGKLSSYDKKQLLDLEEFKHNHTKILGYPYFMNPKRLNQEYDYDNPLVLLFQLKNNGQFNSSIKYISLFIKRTDMINLDFSKLITIVQKKYKT